MKFLHSVSSSKWDWPKWEEIDTKDREFIFYMFYSPIELQGHGLFTIGKEDNKRIKNLYKRTDENTIT